MGLVPMLGPSKTFEGPPTNATNLADENSIQGAIKGTVDDPTPVVKNFSVLAVIAKKDMFVPKRTTVPIDTVAFRGFPRPTIVLVSDYSESSDGDLNISFTITTNNKVGYDIDFTFELRVGFFVGAPVGGLGEGVSFPVVTLPAGQTSATFNFNREGINFDYPWELSLVSVEPPVYDSHLIIDRSGTTEGGSGGGARAPFQVLSQLELSCDNSEWSSGFASPITHWAVALVVGEFVYTDEFGSTYVPDGVYNRGSNCDPSFNTDGTIYQVVSGQITSVLTCSYPPCS